MTRDKGHKLSVADIDMTAVKIASMFDSYNRERQDAIHLGQEARNYVFATDLDSTTASVLPHKNRTHQPKLAEISDTLQSHYWEAAFGQEQFFKFQGDTPEDRTVALKIDKWLKTKFEQKKFRNTVARELIADYVIYGNAFLNVDYCVEKDDSGKDVFKGAVFGRVSPLDIVFDPRATSFNKTAKIVKSHMHIADLADLVTKFPGAGYEEDVLQKIIESRHPRLVEDWVETIHEQNIRYDGYGDVQKYFNDDHVEILTYRGDVFNPETGETQKNRIVTIVDRVHIIRNEPSKSPEGMSGIYHAGWRNRPDNLWAQGPLDILAGMQYRVNHLENLKADVFDIIAQPVMKVRGEQVIEPEEGFAPGAVYYLPDPDSDVSFLVPDSTALNANTEMALYFRAMEDYAGVPPESRGIRSPGEKTAFEISTLDTNSAKMFKDKVKVFELMIEGALQEAFFLMMLNLDGEDYIEVTNDITGKDELQLTAEKDIKARGTFLAVGARHWERRSKMTQEMQQFQLGPMQDPKVRAHINGFELAKFYEDKLGLHDTLIIDQYAGVKEDVELQAVAQAEGERITQEQQQEQQAPGSVDIASLLQQGQIEG